MKSMIIKKTQLPVTLVIKLVTNLNPVVQPKNQLVRITKFNKNKTNWRICLRLSLLSRIILKKTYTSIKMEIKIYISNLELDLP
jgi:hypothetical protein